MTCNKNNGCGCKNRGAKYVAPPCHCDDPEPCKGEKCSELFDAECIILKREGCLISLDSGNTYVDKVTLADALFAIGENKFLTKCE